jgi:hypothetical protein
MMRVTTDDRPSMNACIHHDGGYNIHHSGGYGIYKEMRKIDGVVCCILVDTHTPGYADPNVPGDRYAVPIEQCQWAGDQWPWGGDESATPTLAPIVVVGAWVTQGRPEWWQEFEQRLIEAATWEQLKVAKAKTSASRRTQVMNVWVKDWRYDWLEAKAARLQGEAEAMSQGRLGDAN